MDTCAYAFDFNKIFLQENSEVKFQDGVDWANIHSFVTENYYDVTKENDLFENNQISEKYTTSLSNKEFYEKVKLYLENGNMLGFRLIRGAVDHYFVAILEKGKVHLIQAFQGIYTLEEWMKYYHSINFEKFGMK